MPLKQGSWTLRIPGTYSYLALPSFIMAVNERICFKVHKSASIYLYKSVYIIQHLIQLAWRTRRGKYKVFTISHSLRIVGLPLLYCYELKKYGKYIKYYKRINKRMKLNHFL